MHVVLGRLFATGCRVGTFGDLTSRHACGTAAGLLDPRGRRDVVSIIKRKPTGGLCEAWNAKAWVANDEKVSAVRVFSDGSAKLLEGWPRVAASAGWTAIFLQRL